MVREKSVKSQGILFMTEDGQPDLGMYRFYRKIVLYNLFISVWLQHCGVIFNLCYIQNSAIIKRFLCIEHEPASKIQTHMSI